MKAIWYGTASMALECEGTRIVFDPFVPMEGSEVDTTVDDFAPYEHILVTHGHFDHVASLPQIVLHTRKRIYATDGACQNLERLGLSPKRMRSILPGTGFYIGDFHITPFQGAHIKFDRELVCHTFGRIIRNGELPAASRFLRYMQKFPERGETVGYLIKAEGKRIFLMGSLALKEGVSYPKDVDYLILPYQGNSRLLMHAKAIVDRLQPRTIILDHFDNTFPPISQKVNVHDIMHAKFRRKDGDVIPVICPAYRVPLEL